MKLGLIGKPLGHSFSREIHRCLIDEDYSYWEMGEDEVEDFLKRRDFDGINVTIPHKKTVMPYLDEIEENAARIGAVNTIVNRDGRLYGYNTDYVGFMWMLERNGMDVSGRKVAILGTGGASLAVSEAVRLMGGEAVRISRSRKYEAISYEELYEREKEFSFLVNTTPVGMHPDADAAPVDLDCFSSLIGVADIIANPLRTKLVFEAQQRGIAACGGLEMLVGQALAADEHFLGKRLDCSLIDVCLKKLHAEKRNLVLIGMPSAGKSTIATLLSDRSGRPVIELDQEITEEIGMSIRDYFAKEGEEAFRDRESEAARRHYDDHGVIISCGGGIIKRKKNMQWLAHNGLIVFIDRGLDLLFASESRPLSSNRSDVERLYAERYPLYEQYGDIKVDNNGSLEEVIGEIDRL